ncbi:MAG: hypothetical protein KAH35_07500 [Candidatus Atribacteria bacterium]|nr:hypothetical protein [Candidatus Atribacteria bacterium]
MKRISFFVILSVLFLIISSMLLLIWWPVKATLVEITNSWVAVIMIYLILIVFLYEKPLYELYNELIDFKNPARYHSQQLNQKELFEFISDDNFATLVTYRDPKWESILEKENKQDIYPVKLIDEAIEYIRELQVKRVKWCFLFADIYLVIQAKYILFWFYKFKNVNLDNFNHVWEEKISDFTEQEILLKALLNLEFLKVNEGDISITELGSTYVNYLKKLDKQIDNDEKTIIPPENENE